jgi:hypothetical protein
MYMRVSLEDSYLVEVSMPLAYVWFYIMRFTGQLSTLI